MENPFVILLFCYHMNWNLENKSVTKSNSFWDMPKIRSHGMESGTLPRMKTTRRASSLVYRLARNHGSKLHIDTWSCSSIILFVPRKPQLFMINAVACSQSRHQYAACLPAVRSSFWFLLLCLGLGIRFLDCFVSTYAWSWEKWSSHLCRDKLMT